MHPPSTILCYDCGATAQAGDIYCDACGSGDLRVGEARPHRRPAPPPDPLPGPWALLGRWPEGADASVTLSGPPGSGKSTLAALLSVWWRERLVWFTTEQDAPAAGDFVARIAGLSRAPPIRPVAHTTELLRGLAMLDEDACPVIDSLTRIAGWTGQVEALERAESWCRSGRHRLLVIQQVNQRGDAAGSMEIQHLVGAACYTATADGLRVFGATKNRNGPIGSRYFDIGPHGIQEPTFSYAYTVEGEPGAYRLHAWPLSGARWSGLFDALALIGAPPAPGTASAAIAVSHYPQGVCTPPDSAARRAFAEAHGLHWIDAWPSDQPPPSRNRKD